MAHPYAAIAFTPAVRKAQQDMGSRAAYARMDEGDDPVNHRLSEVEAGFLRERDSLYIATVGETGWPYIQHRGGPAGFVRVLDDTTIGFADFRGNRQYVSVGNLSTDDRVSLFFMDYANRTRLKLFGRARIVGQEDFTMLAQLEVSDYRARVERGIVIAVEAFDWNCPQHIIPRFTPDDVQRLIRPLEHRIAELEAELARR